MYSTQKYISTKQTLIGPNQKMKTVLAQRTRTQMIFEGDPVFQTKNTYSLFSATKLLGPANCPMFCSNTTHVE